MSIELDGYKKIYDVSKWIPFHPGGSAIRKGIEANELIFFVRAFYPAPQRMDSVGGGGVDSTLGNT